MADQQDFTQQLTIISVEHPTKIQKWMIWSNPADIRLLLPLQKHYTECLADLAIERAQREALASERAALQVRRCLRVFLFV